MIVAITALGQNPSPSMMNSSSLSASSVESLSHATHRGHR